MDVFGKKNKKYDVIHIILITISVFFMNKLNINGISFVIIMFIIMLTFDRAWKWYYDKDKE